MNKMVLSIIIAVIAALVGYMSARWLGPDNPVEEACESVIKAETGETVDLSKDSPATPIVTPAAPKVL